MEFYSHIKPDKKLIDHLVEVAELSENMVDPDLQKFLLY